MSDVPTLAVVHPIVRGNALGFVLINASDFDPQTHVLFSADASTPDGATTAEPTPVASGTGAGQGVRGSRRAKFAGSTESTPPPATGA